MDAYPVGGRGAQAGRWMAGVAVVSLGLLGGLTASLRAEEAAAPAEAAPADPEAPADQDAAPDAPAAADLIVGENMDVGLEYTLTVDGSVVDSTEGKTPLHYVHGRNQLIPGLERQLAGMRVGERKDVTIAPEDGYGTVDPNAFLEIPKEQLPTEVPPTVGMVLRGVNPDGQSFQATITEMKDATVVLNLNHPLAGKTLAFNVKVVAIAPAPAPPVAAP